MTDQQHQEDGMTDPRLDQSIWRKSSHSGGSGDCVEVAHLDTRGIAVRDSKDQSGPFLLFTHNAWNAFIAAAKTGEFGAVNDLEQSSV